MFGKLLSLAALTALATAQSAPNLTAALASSPDLSQLAAALALAPPELVSALTAAKNVTILAPSNAAFAKLNASGRASALTNQAALSAVLSYHVLNGTHSAASVTDKGAFIPTLLNAPAFSNVTGGQRVEALKSGNNVVFYSGLLQNSTVTKPDTNFTGGIIHIIDNLLTPPVNVSATAVAAGLSGLVGAVTKADPSLAGTLNTTPDLTIFAPNNAAFSNIGSAIGNLTMQQLTSILGYHVVKGTVGYSSTLMNGTKLQTLAGNNLTITLSGSNVFVNSAKVVIPNVLVANGVVHVIDNVLNPNATSATPNPSASSQSVAFAGASSAAIGGLTSGVPTATMMIGSGPAQASSASAAAAASSSTSSGVAMPMRTGAIGAAALFAGAGAAWNF